MYEYIKGLSVTLCLLSEKIEDSAFANVFKSESLDLIKKSSVLLNLENSKNSELLNFRNHCIQLITLLDLTKISRKISHMNALVITNSIVNFIKELDKKIVHTGSFSQTLLHLKELDQNLFRILAKNSLTAKIDSSKSEFGFTKISDLEFEEKDLEVSHKISDTKDVHNTVKEVVSTQVESVKNLVSTTSSVQPNNGSLVYTTFGDSEQKHIEERRLKILSILKLGGGNIRDLSKNFPGVNEKTLQRDLIELMREKKVIMLGKKRWAKYYLK